MSFEINNEISDLDKIYYNYPTYKIYKTQYEKTLENGGYIKVGYAAQPNTINIDYADFDSGYVTKNMYISKKVHSIDNVDFQGEILIEHVSNTNGFRPLYICIPVRTNTKMEATDIDRIIAHEENIVEFNINDVLDNDIHKAILYESPGYLTEQHVLLFTNPIEIKSSFDDFLVVDVVKNYDETYRTILTEKLPVQNTTPTPTAGVEGFRSRNKTKTSTAYCQPIDEIEPDVQNEASLEVPLKGKYSLKDSEYEYIKTVVSFTSYFLAMVFGYLGAPSLYKNLIVDLVNENENLQTCMARAGRLYSIDIYICVVMIMFVYSLLSNGVKTNSKGKTTTALLVFIFFIVSLLRIYLFKIDLKGPFPEMIQCDEYDETKEPDPENPNEYITEEIQQDFAEFASENVGLFNNVTVFGIFLFLMIITLTILFTTNAGSLWLFGILLDVYIVIFYVVKSKAKGGDEEGEKPEE